MNRPFQLAIILLGACLQFLHAEPQEAETNDLTLEEVLKIGSCTLSDKSAHKEFLVVSEIAGPADMPAGMRMRNILAWRAPDQALLILLPSDDNSPFLVVAAGDAIVYDPVRMQLLAMKGVGADVVFKLEVDGLQGSWGLKSGRDNLIDIDFGSLLRRSTEGVRLVKTRDHTYTFEGSSKSGRSRCRAVVSQQATIPLQKFEMFGRENPQPEISFTRIDGDPSLDIGLFKSPIERAEELALPIKFLEPEENIPALKSALMGWTPFRTGIDDPSTHKKLEPLLPPGFNWDNAKKRDAKARKALRDIFLALLKDLGIQQVGADQPATSPESKSEEDRQPKLESEVRPQ